MSRRTRITPGLWLFCLSLICTSARPLEAADPPFNQVQMKHSHNSYQRPQTLYEQARSLMVRSFEIDLYGKKDGTAVSGNWYVYHTSSDSGTTCTYLTDALGSLMQFHNENPSHEVITVWIEMKEPFSAANSQTPAAMDSVIRSAIPPASLFTPRDMVSRGSYSSLRDTVKNVGWPTLSQLRGKFMFVILGNINDYIAGYDNNASAVFLQFVDKNSIFLNVGIGQYSRSDYDDGLVNRLTRAEYTTGYTAQQAWTMAIDSRMQYLGTDSIDFAAPRKAWATANNINGYPFRSVLFDYSAEQETLSYTLFPDGYPYQLYWGSRAGAVASSGGAEWLVDVNGDGKSDYVYAKEGTREYKVLSSEGYKLAEESTLGGRTHDVAYAGLSEWFADLDGDGRGDLVYARNGTEEIWAGLNTGDALAPDSCWGVRSYAVAASGGLSWLVDVSGDGRSDYVYARDRAREYRVLLSSGSSLVADTAWGSRSFGVAYGGSAQWIADMNGDGRKDLVYNRNATRQIRVRLSSGGSLGPEAAWGTGGYAVGRRGASQWLVDLDGDGKTDYVYNREGTKEYRVRLSTGSSLGGEVSWGSRTHDVDRSGTAEWLTDVDGDGRADHVYNRLDTGEYYVRSSTGSGFAPEKLLCYRNDACHADWIVDMNGDGTKDLISARDRSKELWAKMTR